jgi:myo-inositol-1(or 4)-monophosphatase
MAKNIKNKVNLKLALNSALEVAELAGTKLLRYRKKISGLKIKVKDAQGVATEADIQSEKLIIRELTKKFPGIPFLAEEEAYAKYGGKSHAYSDFKKNEWGWVVDPLDGTNNFLAGMDYFAVCISLVHYGKPVLGVVYRPVNGDCFYALAGEKTKFKNILTGGRAKNIFMEKAPNNLKSSLLVTGFATEKGEKFDREFDIFVNMMGKCRGIRRMGSAALDLCYVASGVFDGFWERGLSPWDVSAAGLICQSAGVKVTDYKGQKFCPFDETIMAGRQGLYPELKRAVN